MKTTFSRWLPAITQTRIRIAVLGVGALAIGGALVAGPAGQAAFAASETPATVTTAAAAAKTDVAAKADVAKDKGAKKKKTAPSAKTLKRSFKYQPNYYFCGPAATRIALSANKKAPSQYTIAKQLRTTTDGTNSVRDVSRVLNKQLGDKRYHATFIGGKKASAKQVAKLRADVVASVGHGDPVVANIAGTVKDKAGETHSYEGGHYLTIVGYSDKGHTVKIEDPADTNGGHTYKLSTKKMANWIATRGYVS